MSNERAPDSVIEGKLFGLWKRGVYVYGWRRGSEYLYIGVTSNLFARMGCHTTVNQTEPVAEGDAIDLWCFAENYSREISNEAIAFERAMIIKHSPRYNVAGRSLSIKETNREVRMEKWRKEYREQRAEEAIGWSDNKSWE